MLLTISAFSRHKDKEQSATKSISGKVTDVRGNEIPAAIIIINETRETFLTDANGNFNIKIKADKVYTISISAIGYLPLESSSTRLGSFSEINLQELSN